MRSRDKPLAIIAAIIIAVSLIGQTAKAEEPELKKIWATGYCLQGKMANGEETREGVCAYRREDLGKTAILYDLDMNLIGMYEIDDVGGREQIRKGYVIDVWFPTADECFGFTQQVYVQIVDAEG